MLFSKKSIISLVLAGALAGVVIGLYFGTSGFRAQAAWYNYNWLYRIPYIIRNTGARVTNQQVKIEVDTAGMISASRLQSSCQDIRFTDKNGSLLDHRIGTVSGGSISYIDSTSTTSGVNETSKTFSHTIASGSNRALVVIVQTQQQQTGDNPFDITSVTWNGTSLTQGPEIEVYGNLNSNRNYSTEIFYLLSPEVGTYNIVVTAGEDLNDWIIGAINFTGVGSIGGSDTDNNEGVSISSATSNTVTITTSDAGSYLVGGGGGRADFTAPSIDVGTEVYDTNTGTANTDTAGNGWYYSPGSAGSTSVTMSRSGGSFSMAAIELVPAAGSVTGDLCNNASTDFYVKMAEIPTGNTTIYMYYGNSGASSTALSTAFSETLFSPASLTMGKVQQITEYALQLALDEGQGSTTYDASGNGYNGTLTNATWQTEDRCVAGKCVFFDGTGDFVDVGTGPSIVKTVSFWARPSTTSEYFIDLNGSAYIRASSGTLSATGFTSPTIYVNGKVSSTIQANVWQHITVTTATALNASDLDIGRLEATDDYQGFIDEVTLYPYARTAAQVQVNYNQIANAYFGPDNTYLSSGLVGYWKMDDAGVDAEGETSTDSSGNGNNGTLYGDNSTGDNGTGMDCTVGGMFGTGCDFDGTDDYVNTGTWNVTSDEFAIATWVNLDSVASNNRDHIISKWNASSNDRSYMVAANYGAVSGNIAFGVSDLGTNFMIKTTSGSVVNADTWYHIVAVYRKGNFEIYVNGVSQSLSTSTSSGDAPTGAPESNSTSVYLGGAQYENGSAQYGDCTLDSARIYNRALSSQEVRDLYAWAPGPIIHYKLDENSGTSSVYDSSGSGNIGTMNGSMTSADWVPGKFGSALDFDGSNDYISSNSQVTLSSMTYTAWLKTSTAQPAFAGVMSSTSTGGTFAQLQWNGTTNSIRVQIDNGTPSKDYYASQDLEDGKWHHVGFTYDAPTENLILYIDGVPQSVTKLNDDAIGAYSITQYIQVGVERLAGTFFTGIIDDARVYNYPLTQKQITNVMNAQAPGDKAIGSPLGHPVGYWEMDEGYGSTTYDSSVNATSGTITGATWSSSGKFGKALSFDGSGDSVSLTDPSSGVLDPTTALTLSAWIYPETDGEANFGRIISEVASVDLFVTSDDNSAISLCAQTNSVTDTCTDSDSIPLNTWSHIAVVYTDPNSRKFYINGVLVLENDSTNNLANDASSKIIGDRAAGGRSFDGFIDEVKIYNYALSEDEVKLDFNRGSGLVVGSLSTASDGTTSDTSSARKYCVPGDTSTCNPPVLEYNFSENTGTTSTYDTSDNSYTGTLTGMASTSWVPGVKGSALYFDNSTSYVTATTEDANLSTNIYTYTAWIYRTSDPGTDLHILDNRDANSDGVTMKITNGSPDTVRCEHNATTLDSTSTMALNTWYFVACVSDSSTLRIYVNGVQENSTAISGSIAETTDFRVGARSHTSPSQYFSGYIDQVKVYTYARSPAQIAWEYNRGEPIAWYPFDECSGTTINDWAQNGLGTFNARNGTLTIGATGSNTSAGYCSSGTSTEAWNNGTTGKFNSAMSFDGTDDYVTTSTEGSNFSLSQFTYTAWVKQSSDPGSNRFIIDNRDADNDGVLLHVLNGTPDKFECQYNSTDTAGTTTVANDTWYHVACVADGSNIKVYVNGKLENSSAQSGSISESTNMRIGARSHTSAASYFPGLIDDVRIYNYGLTASQVKEVMNDGAVSFK